MTTYWDVGFNIHLTPSSYNLMNGLIYMLTFMVHQATQSLGRTLSATYRTTYLMQKVDTLFPDILFSEESPCG